MSDFGIMNPEDYFTSTSTGSNISALSNMLGLMGNPLFLYTQGVLTPEMLLDAIRQSTSETVDLSGGDFKALEDAAADDPSLSTGFDMIKRGYSISSIMRVLTDQAQTDGELSQFASKTLDYVKSDLEEYKKRWDIAQGAMEKVQSGEYFYDANGSLRSRMETGKAMDVLAQMGLPKYLQNPMMWEVVPDQDLINRALAKDSEAESILKSLAPIVDMQTGLLRPGESKKLAKEMTKTGTSVYQEFLRKTPEGKNFLKQVTQKKPTGPTEQGRLATDLKKIYSAVESGDIRKMISTGQVVSSRSLESLLRNVAKGAVTAGKNVIKSFTGPSLGQQAKKMMEEGKKQQTQDYWAKLAGSYASRAKYEEQRKPISDLQARAAAAKAAADRIAQEAVLKGRQQGNAPALGFIQQAYPLAQMMTAPAPRVSVAPAPRRTLSDAEIDQMSSMLAYGSNA